MAENQYPDQSQNNNIDSDDGTEENADGTRQVGKRRSKNDN